MKPNNIPFSKLLPVWLLGIAVSWALYFAEISPLFTIIGFRIYIPFLPLLYIIYLRIVAGEDFTWRPFPWKTSLVIVVGMLLIAAAGWQSGLLKFRLPEFHFELAASSVVDFPVYFIWNFPMFALVWFGLFIRAESGWQRLLSALMILLVFSPQFFSHGSEIKNIADALPLVVIAVTLTGISFFSKTVLQFALLSFTICWSILIIYGTDNLLLLNTFLAYRYDTWEGFFKAKPDMINYFRAGSAGFALIVMALAFEKNS